MDSWIVANRDFLWAAVVVVLALYGVLKPKMVGPDGKVGFSPIEMAEMTVRAARAMYIKGDGTDPRKINEERVTYAIGQLAKFFPRLDTNQLKVLIEGAWDRVKGAEMHVVLPEVTGEIDEPTLANKSVSLSRSWSQT